MESTDDEEVFSVGVTFFTCALDPGLDEEDEIMVLDLVC